MSIEALMTELRDALNANTEALKAAAASGSTAVPEKAEPKSTGKGKADKKEEAPKITQEQVNAALIKIKDDFGMEHAKAVIKEFGKVDKMAEIKPAQFQAVFDAAVAKHAELTEAGSGDGDM